jgi:hypothetical protein
MSQLLRKIRRYIYFLIFVSDNIPIAIMMIITREQDAGHLNREANVSIQNIKKFIKSSIKISFVEYQ